MTAVFSAQAILIKSENRKSGDFKQITKKVTRPAADNCGCSFQEKK